MWLFLTHEKVVCVWVGAADFEELHQVVKLAVYVSAYCYWAFLCIKLGKTSGLRDLRTDHWLYVGLFL